MKILYGVQTTGHGHLTRSALLRDELQRLGAVVDVFLSGADSTQAFAMTLFPNARFMPGPTLITKNGALKHWQTLFNAEFFKFVKSVHSLSLDAYDLVITDFEPITAWAARFQKKMSIGISNQYTMTHGSIRFPMFAPLAKLVDRFFAPAKLSIGLHWCDFGPYILPPIIPVEILDAGCTVDSQSSVVVYLPFESVDQIRDFLQAAVGTRFDIFHPAIKSPFVEGHLYWHPLGRSSFLSRLSSCHGLISNAGFETLSEAIYLGKKILAKPLHRQAEQMSNVEILVEKGFGTSMQSLDSHCLIDWLRQNTQTTTVAWPNVARQIAQWIYAGDWSQVSQLHQSCWCAHQSV